MTNGRPTVIDIARKLNISPSSVSRAIRNAGKVGAPLRERILKEAEKMGYSPDPAARALRNSRSRLIGLIVPTLYSPEIDDLVTNIQLATQTKDFGVVLGVSNWDTAKEIQLLEFMTSKRVEGIIIKSKGAHSSLEKIFQLSSTNVRIVSLLDKVDFPNVSSVVVDNIHGGYLATKHLLEHNHTKIAYVTYTESMIVNDTHASHFSRERLCGMLKAYKEAGFERPDNMLILDEGGRDNYKSENTFTKLLDDKVDFSAVFTYDDQLAATAAKVFKNRGISIPDQISIVGFDDNPTLSTWCEPPLTVIKQPADMIGFEAVNILLGSPASSKCQVEQNVYTITPYLVERGSVAKMSANPASAN